MKVRKIKDGVMLEVGDRIQCDTSFGVKWETIHRVTKRFAFVRYNDVAEGKYKREYQDFGFCPLPRQQWRTTQYSAWRPV
jgi:hypothetical protein